MTMNPDMADGIIDTRTDARSHRAAQNIIHVPRPDRVMQFVRARLDPPRIGRETARAVLDHFHLALIGEPRNLPFGRRNRTVLVETAKGRKVLKLYRSGWLASSIVHEHSILLHLAQRGVPAPRLAATPAGDTLLSQGNRHYAVFDFIPGTNFASSYVVPAHRRQLLVVAGRTLAHLHRSLAGFEPEGRHHLGFSSYEDDWHDLAWYLQKLEQLPQQTDTATDPDAKIQATCLAAASDRIRTQLMQLHERFQETPPARGIIHGDYGVHNILFQRNGTAVVHDFELARLEWRLSDLVIALSRLDVNTRRTFLAAYQSVNPMEERERRLLPLVWQAYMLQGAIRSWNNYFELDGGRRLEKACARMQHADWALAHPERLLAN